MDRNINFSYDLDYSKDKNIDKRVLQVCATAEAKYLENQKNKKSDYLSRELDINDLIINNNNITKRSNTINELKKTLETSNSNVQNKSYFTGSKLGKIENKSLEFEKNILSQKYFNKNLKFKSPKNAMQNINSFSIMNFPNSFENNKYNNNNNENNKYNNNNENNKYNNNNENNKYNNNNFNEIQNIQKINNINEKQNFLFPKNNNIIYNNINLNKSNDIPKILNNNENQESFSPINSNNNNNINLKPLDNDNLVSENFKSIQKKYNKKYILSHNIHIKNKNKYELNKILLQSQSFIKNHKYMHAYYLLRNTIAAGEYHSDLFYLYGEVNRILKNYEEAEDYLLLALNFEIHSPYVFYSMGLLYQNLNQYNYSNIFLRLFQRLINNDNVHYLISKNYMKIGDLLKAAKEMTIAIKMNKEKDIYYKFRSEIYNKMGMNEMSNEDLSMYNYIKNINIEENK